jgi:hypothetical protein
MSCGQEEMMDSQDSTLKRLSAANPVRHVHVDDVKFDALLDRVMRTPTQRGVLRRHKVRVAAFVGVSATLVTAVAMTVGPTSLAPSLALRTAQHHRPVGLVTTSTTMPVATIGGGKASIFIPAANYVYAVDPLLSSALVDEPTAVRFTSSSSADVLNSIATATGVPTGGNWVDQDGALTYQTQSGGNWALTSLVVNDVTSFTFQSSMSTCDAIPANPPIVNFDSDAATNLSNAFLQALGYSPDSFSAPVDGSSMWQCGFGAQWSFSRLLQVSGTNTNIQFSFTYNVPTGSLFSASGYIVTLGSEAPTTPVSAFDAANALATSHNDTATTDPSLSTVRVTLGTPSVSLDAYQLADGTLALLPVYDFGSNVNCVPASAYCTATSLQVLGIDPVSAATATPLFAPASGIK